VLAGICPAARAGAGFAVDTGVGGTAGLGCSGTGSGVLGTVGAATTGGRVSPLGGCVPFGGADGELTGSGAVEAGWDAGLPGTTVGASGAGSFSGAVPGRGAVGADTVSAEGAIGSGAPHSEQNLLATRFAVPHSGQNFFSSDESTLGAPSYDVDRGRHHNRALRGAMSIVIYPVAAHSLLESRAGCQSWVGFDTLSRWARAQPMRSPPCDLHIPTTWSVRPWCRTLAYKQKRPGIWARITLIRYRAPIWIFALVSTHARRLCAKMHNLNRLASRSDRNYG